MPAPRKSQRSGQDPHRLDGSARPSRYAVELAVDPARTRRYRGSVAIELSLSRACSAVELHAVDLDVRSARFVVDGKRITATVEPLPDVERIVVRPSRPLAKGEAVLELSFHGTLRADLRGLYFVRNGALCYAFSQLEAADARRFFPCFDEPLWKARFAISVVTAARNTVVSNGAIARTERLPRAQKRVTFRETPKISTYLVALAVGELDASRAVRAGPTKIRVLHVPGKAHLSGFALGVARECLLRLERYFGMPYPYEKLDLVAVPEFEMGAMENVGAVFFRETLLLVDERRASLLERKRVLEVMCHELAHMWYGNLVTMAWWDDLWLNEAFATWMAYAIVAEWQPELHMWNDFGHARNSAMQLDALASTHPIYTKVRTPDEATQSFDLITYEKGAAVIRMLERYLGAERFRRGVRDYIFAHREGNAKASDLWRALETHAGDAVDHVVRPWIERPGFPLLRVRARQTAGRQVLRLEQARLWANGKRDTRDKPWPLPLVLALTSRGKRREHRMLLDRRSATLTLPRGTTLLYANADEGGFYRPLPDRPLLRTLYGRLDELHESERLGLVTHVFAIGQAGHGSVVELLELTLALRDETDPDVLAALQPPLRYVLDQLIERPVAQSARAQEALGPRLQAIIANAFEPAFEGAFITGRTARRPASSERARQRRGELLALLAVVAEHAGAVETAEAVAVDYLRAPGAADPSLLGAALAAFARSADLRGQQRLLRALRDAATPQEARRLRLTLGEHRDAACIEHTLGLCLGSTIPVQDVAGVLTRLLHNPSARDVTWRFIRNEWSRLRGRVAPLLMSRVIDALPALASEPHRQQVATFFRKHPVPSATRALAQADERFAIDARMRTRALPELTTWVRAQGAPR